MNHTGEFCFYFGRLAKRTLGDFQLLWSISSNMFKLHLCPQFTDVVHATTIIHSEVSE